MGRTWVMTQWWQSMSWSGIGFRFVEIPAQQKHFCRRHRPNGLLYIQAWICSEGVDSSKQSGASREPVTVWSGLSECLATVELDLVQRPPELGAPTVELVIVGQSEK